MHKAFKLFSSTKKLIEKTKNWENWPGLQVVEVVLFQWDLVDNQYLQNSEILYTFTSNKSFAYLIKTEPSNSVLTEFNGIIRTLIRMADC